MIKNNYKQFNRKWHVTMLSTLFYQIDKNILPPALQHKQKIMTNTCSF